MGPPILIDAFAGPHARGNRAAVVVCDTLPGQLQMQELAIELDQPATAFVCAQEQAGWYAIRWFDAKREIALCGHGALAAGHVLLAQSPGGEIRFHATDGRELIVRKSEAENRYELCLPAILTGPRDWPELAAALRAEPQEIRWNGEGYALAVFADAQTVPAVEPDLAALTALGNIQISVTAPGGERSDIVSRIFSRGREDAATGSAHAALAPYWSARLGQQRFSAFQASAHGGAFICRIDGDEVWLGGKCCPVT